MTYKRNDPRLFGPARDRRCYRCGTQWRLLLPAKDQPTVCHACWRASKQPGGAPSLTITQLPDAGPAEMLDAGASRDSLETTHARQARRSVKRRDSERRRKRRKRAA